MVLNGRRTEPGSITRLERGHDARRFPVVLGDKELARSPGQTCQVVAHQVAVLPDGDHRYSLVERAERRQTGGSLPGSRRSRRLPP